MVPCPECSVGVAVGGGSAVSEVIECADCHSELEIISLDPVRLAVAPDVEEDWGE
jgi:alpha-aminoadipate carrier protein LysW